RRYPLARHRLDGRLHDQYVDTLCRKLAVERERKAGPDAELAPDGSVVWTGIFHEIDPFAGERSRNAEKRGGVERSVEVEAETAARRQVASRHLHFYRVERRRRLACRGRPVAFRNRQSVEERPSLA